MGPKVVVVSDIPVVNTPNVSVSNETGMEVPKRKHVSSSSENEEAINITPKIKKKKEKKNKKPKEHDESMNASSGQEELVEPTEGKKKKKKKAKLENDLDVSAPGTPLSDVNPPITPDVNNSEK